MMALDVPGTCATQLSPCVCVSCCRRWTLGRCLGPWVVVTGTIPTRVAWGHPQLQQEGLVAWGAGTATAALLQWWTHWIGPCRTCAGGRCEAAASRAPVWPWGQG
jgi:hypothetical protein